MLYDFGIAMCFSLVICSSWGKCEEWKLTGCDKTDIYKPVHTFPSIFYDAIQNSICLMNLELWWLNKQSFSWTYTGQIHIERTKRQYHVNLQSWGRLFDVGGIT